MQFRQENKISATFDEVNAVMVPVTEAFGIAASTALIGTLVAKNKMKGALIGGAIGLGTVFLYRHLIIPAAYNTGLI